jgi:hypothetical protein
MIPNELDLQFIVEPAEAYHAATKDYLSSHRLADFRRCPLLYQRKQAGLIADEDRPAYLVGRAAHTAILEGDDRFAEEYAVGGPVNPRTGQAFGSNTKAFAEWAAAIGRPVLTDKQAEFIERMAAGVRAHEFASRLLDVGVAEMVIRTEWHGLACQARVDWFTYAEGASLVDLKTCDNLDYFETDARRYGYAHQLAFYRSIASGAARLDPRELPVHLIAVEKCEPFRCGVWRMGEDVMAVAQRANEEAVKRLRDCRQRDVWPTNYEPVRAFDWI